MRQATAIAADIACAVIGMGLIRNADSLPSWADLTCTCVGVIFLWLCLVTWPWEKKEPTAPKPVDEVK